MMVIGLITKCMDKEDSHGQMVNTMLENIRMIKRTVMGNFIGQMENITKEVGRMDRNMVKQFKDNHKLILLEIGKMEKEFLKNEI